MLLLYCKQHFLTHMETVMAKGQVNKGKKNAPKLSVKEKKAKKKEKQATKSRKSEE